LEFPLIRISRGIVGGKVTYVVQSPPTIPPGNPY